MEALKLFKCLFGTCTSQTNEISLKTNSHIVSEKHALEKGSPSFTNWVFVSILTSIGHNLVLSERLGGRLWNAFGYYLFISSILDKSRNKPCSMSYKAQMAQTI